MAHTRRLHLNSLHLRSSAIAGRATAVRDRVSRFVAAHERATLACTALVIVSAISGIGAALLWPQTVQYSLSGQTCTTSPAILPTTTSLSSQRFHVTAKGTLHIGKTTLLAQSVCVSARTAPTKALTDTVTLKPLAFLPLGRELRIITPTPPAVSYGADPKALVSSRGTLTYQLGGPENTFSYTVGANNQQTPCTKAGTTIYCPLSGLKLAQSVSYPISLYRAFQGKTESQPLITINLTTVEPLIVTATSIGQNQTVYDIPTALKLTFNKPIASPSDAVLSSNNKPVTTTLSTSGKELTVTWAAPLARSATFSFTPGSVTGTDGAFLDQPYMLTFAMSGGPKVVSKSFGSTRLSQTASLTLTLDSDLQPNQDLKSFLSLNNDSGAIPFTVSSTHNTITVSPSAAMGRCSNITLTLKDGLKNAAGITGGSAWSTHSRALCQTSFSIGTSVQGRSITAYSFGTGGTKILFVGNTHGNEKSSRWVLEDLIDYLEDNPSNIPSDRTVVIVPSINPDGFAANTRVNANTVDLNRNFPANNWKSAVTMPDHSYLATGGGTAPLSEPESKAIANYATNGGFKLILTYHSHGGVVVPNTSGSTVNLAHTYADLSSVYYMANDNTTTFFDYDTTGAFEDWLHDAYGQPALLIEMNSDTNADFSGHRAAMLAMIKS